MDEYKDWVEYDEDNDINIAQRLQDAQRDTLKRSNRCAPFTSPFAESSRSV